MKISQNLYYMFPLKTSYFLVWSRSIWGFLRSKTRYLSFVNMGTGDSSLISYFSYTTEWNWMKPSQNLLHVPIVHLLFLILIQIKMEVKKGHVVKWGSQGGIKFVSIAHSFSSFNLRCMLQLIMNGEASSFLVYKIILLLGLLYHGHFSHV